MSRQKNSIERYILQHVAGHPRKIVGIAAQHFDVTTQTVHRHLARLISSGQIIKTGQTKQTSYYLAKAKNKNLHFSLAKKQDEFVIWTKYFEPDFSHLSEEVYSIIEYFTTEVINNAIDHSRGKNVTVSINWTADNIKITVSDDGVGVFNSIQEGFNLSDIRESPLELSKGKVTTNPSQHTGEGLFFSSKAADVFTIDANGITYCVDNLLEDWFIKESDLKKGSQVSLEIAQKPRQKLTDIFLYYQNEDTLEFGKTEIYVDLSIIAGERLISRSQAKRIIRNLEGFDIIILDFKKVVTVGQGFVDQIFRVYQAQYPDKKIDYCNANETVEFMIKRSLPPKE